MTKEQLEKIASQVRRDIVRMVTAAGSGHPGGSMSTADILTALYFEVMDHDPATWKRDGKGQDQFILRFLSSGSDTCIELQAEIIACFLEMGGNLIALDVVVEQDNVSG